MGRGSRIAGLDNIMSTAAHGTFGIGAVPGVPGASYMGVLTDVLIGYLDRLVIRMCLLCMEIPHSLVINEW
jgi:hypothetical protein